MTHDPTTPEGRDELRRLLTGDAPIWEWRLRAARALESMGVALDALDVKDVEIAALQSSLAGRDKVVKSCKAIKDIALREAHEEIEQAVRQNAEIAEWNQHYAQCALERSYNKEMWDRAEQDKRCLVASLAAQRNINWRRGGAFGDLAEWPPSNVDLFCITKDHFDTKGVVVAKLEVDGGFWTASHRVVWMNIIRWMPLGEMLATLPDDRE